MPPALLANLPEKPLAVDLFCGLGGWTEGLMAEGWRTRGYDIEAHEYDGDRYPGELVLRDILDMHGSEIADADLIVSSTIRMRNAFGIEHDVRWKTWRDLGWWDVLIDGRGVGRFEGPYVGWRSDAGRAALEQGEPS